MPVRLAKPMIVRLSGEQFLLGGNLCHFTFRPVGVNAGKAWAYLKVEEGHYENGSFQASYVSEMVTKPIGVDLASVLHRLYYIPR